jgi:acetyl esterase/lipase
MDRRSFLSLPRSADPSETIRLWPGVPPGGAGVSLTFQSDDMSKDPSRHSRLLRHVAEPKLWVCRPDNPNGSAVLVIPGGGYTVIVVDWEGFETARTLNREGITAFVLQYRLPAEGWADSANVPLQDMQRAMRLIRAHAKDYGIDPARLGVVGFSAGGHMAGTLATRYGEQVYAPVDAADQIDPKPAFAGLIYPVITLGPGTHADSRNCLLGSDQSQARIDAYSCDKRVTAATVPSFVSCGQNDTLVPPGPNGLAMYKALMAAKVPCELHAFENGPHGYGMSSENPIGGENAKLFLAWGRQGGWFKA